MTINPIRNRCRRLLAVAGAAALTASVLATAPAGAAPGPAAGPYDRGPAGDALQTIAQTYLATSPGLTPAAAQAAAAAQASGGEALKVAIKQQWKAFGGGWFDPYTATYHVAVTTTAAGKALAGIGATRGVAVKTPLVARSLDQLTAQAAALRTGKTALARAANGNVGIDVKTNQVVASVAAGKATSLRRQAPEGVTVVAAKKLDVEADACTTRANCDDFLAAGLTIRNGNPGVHSCSLGFTARNAANQRITLTAGHCSTGVGQVWSNGTSTIRVIGSVSGRIDSGNVDVTRIVSTNTFYGNVNSGRIYVSPAANTVPVKGESFLLVNDVACLSARFTAPATAGNPCGTVGSIADAGNRGMVRVDGYDACPGDSGGGWYWLAPSGNRYAVSLHSRSESGCNATPARSWSSPLNAFYSDLNYETS